MTLYRRELVQQSTDGNGVASVWRYVPVEPDQFQRVRQGGGMGSWRCNTCGTDCRADGPGCEGSDYDFTPSYWPDNDGDYMLVPCPGAGVGGSEPLHMEKCVHGNTGEHVIRDPKRTYHPSELCPGIGLT